MKKLRVKKINLAKFSIIFSPNMIEEDKMVKDILCLINAQPHDYYPGLPTVVGRNKHTTFGSMRDRVWKSVGTYDLLVRNRSQMKSY